MARKKARGARGAGGKPGRQERAARLPDWVFRPGPGPQGSRPPWGLLLAALALAWAARVAVALVGDFILHPDEIFQYYEPAHGVVFGNAIYTWEMATGARSFLIPGFIAGLLYALDFLGYGEPVHYVPAVKVVLCTISLALPVSMYFIARSLWSERAGVVAFLFGCFWYEFVGFAHKPLSDMLSCYAAMASIAFACARGRTPTTLALSGLMAALTIGLRWQVGIMLVPFALLLLGDLGRRRSRDYVLAGLAGIAAFGVLDHLAWGGFFHSVHLNVISNLAVNPLIVPGSQASDVHYFLWTAWASAGAFWVVALAALGDWRRYLPFLLLLAVFFATHSFLVHKEYRFAFPWLPLWLMMAADLSVRLAERLGKARRGAAAALGGAGALAAGISALGIANALPYQDDLYLSYSVLDHDERHFLGRDPHLELYLRLSQDEAIDGVLEFGRPLLGTGGYYYFHRKAALIPPQVFKEIQRATGERPDIRNWVTHVIAEPNKPPEPNFIVTEVTPHYTLSEVLPERRVPVMPMESHIFAPDIGEMMGLLPELAGHLPQDRDLRPRFGER